MMRSFPLREFMLGEEQGPPDRPSQNSSKTDSKRTGKSRVINKAESYAKCN